MNNSGQNPYNPFLAKLNERKPPTLDELDQILCPKCGNIIFDRYFKMYKLSALKTASGKEQLFNVPVYVCASCSEILDTSNIDNETEKDPSKENQVDKEK